MFRINQIEVEVIPCQHIAYVFIGGQLCHIVAESGHIGGLCFLTAFRLRYAPAIMALISFSFRNSCSCPVSAFITKLTICGSVQHSGNSSQSLYATPFRMPSAPVYHSSCLDVGGINAPSTSSINCMSIVLPLYSSCPAD